MELINSIVQFSIYFRTLENCNLGEAMIKSLQEQGHQMAKEKQKMLGKCFKYIKKLFKRFISNNNNNVFVDRSIS